MPQDTCNLKWNHFNGNLDFNLKELLFGNKLTDVTLVSDDKIAFKAHKFLLGACSPVLRDLLIKTFHPQPTIYLRGIHSYELEAILYFLYLGKTQFYHIRMKKFFEAGKELQLNQLKDDLVIDRENEVANDSAIEPEDDTDVSKKSYLNEQNLGNKVNVEDGNLKHFASSVINALVTESDRNTYKPYVCKECKVDFKYKKT